MKTILEVSPRGYLKSLQDLARLWEGRRPHPLGMMQAATTAAWFTGLIALGDMKDRRKAPRPETELRAS